MPAGIPHPYIVRRKKKISGEKYIATFIDQIIWIIAIAGPAFTLPQVFLIWTAHEAAGVSLVAWGGYTLLSAIWFLYGKFHKEKAIMFSSGLNFVANILVLSGTVLYQ